MNKEQAEKEIQYRLSKNIFYNLLCKELITEEQFEKMRDALIDTYEPTIGGLERRMPWQLSESQK